MYEGSYYHTFTNLPHPHKPSDAEAILVERCILEGFGDITRDDVRLTVVYMVFVHLAYLPSQLIT